MKTNPTSKTPGLVLNLCTAIFQSTCFRLTGSCLIRMGVPTRLVFLYQSGQLNEYTERKEMSADVVCMSLANVPPGEQRSRFLAVGLVDNTVRIISLDPSVSAC